MQSKDFKKTLIIFVEIKQRELDSRLLIALEGLRKDFNVIIGEKNSLLRSLRLGLLPKGVILDKCAQPVSLKIIKKLKNRGYIYTSIDEEALAIADEKNFALSRYNKETINESEIIFTWGNKHDRIMKKYYNETFRRKFIKTGNPRIELLRNLDKFYDVEINKIKAKYNGRIILFPSNFSYYTFNAKISFKNYMIESNIHIEDIDGLVKTYKKNYYAFIDLINEMSVKFKNDSLIWRPHPTDSKKKLIKDTKNLENVFIDSEYGITPWLYSSDILIHLGCTTALEMYQLEKPVISYEKYFNKRHRNALPNFMSKRFSKQADVIQFVEDFFTLDSYYDNRKKLKKTMSENLFYNPKNSSAAIVDAIDKLKIRKIKINQFKLIFINPLLFVINLIIRVKLFILYKDSFRTYYEQKFDFISKNNVIRKLKHIDSSLHFSIKKLNRKIIFLRNEKY